MDHETTADRGPAETLRTALEAAHRRHADAPAPCFSEDGGATVSDRWGRDARLQPLGDRTRITLADDDRVVAEGEVDAAGLVDRIGGAEATYDVLAALLDEENGPGTRSD